MPFGLKQFFISCQASRKFLNGVFIRSIGAANNGTMSLLIKLQVSNTYGISLWGITRQLYLAASANGSKTCVNQNPITALAVMGFAGNSVSAGLVTP